MNLLSADTFVVDQPWTPMRLMLGSKYLADAYDGHDVLLGSVRETRRGFLTARLRNLSLSRWTPFSLQVLSPTGQPVLVVTKSAGIGKRPTKVAWPNGQPVGSIVPQPGRYALLDVNGTQLCLLGDVIQLHIGQIKKRNGKRVRRDVVQVRPGTSEPVRSLAVAAAVAFDIVRGVGTNHLSSDASGFLPGE
ncbi:hypothetical protein BBK82_15530 [Lentzea guizhouensis]|uniref:Scramblase n=1 Tax=Lentzea guizhouensis TaxID=1586287 RepID=A0A1B2HHQ4_9PSEU|nr:hypothetical protein [Lentzea guizhouensis]ANZ37263.1 hypothetical protein BBK82_15530 [Lentzea guizhouensis]